jgi:hypothetical protein
MFNVLWNANEDPRPVSVAPAQVPVSACISSRRVSQKQAASPRHSSSVVERYSEHCLTDDHTHNKPSTSPYWQPGSWGADHHARATTTSLGYKDLIDAKGRVDCSLPYADYSGACAKAGAGAVAQPGW